MTSHPAGAAVVTGANRADGIGLALVRELRRRGCAPVVGTYRDRAGSAALLELADDDEDVLAAELDVASEQSVEAFGAWCHAQLEGVRLLVNNAGIGSPAGSITTEPIADLEHGLQVHGVGMLRVTRALLPLMAAGSVMVSVSSTLGSLASMGRGSAFYGPAKALQNALTKQLAATVAADGIVAFSVSPGWVQTSMGSSAAPLTPEESARRLAELVLSASPSDSGTFRDIDGATIPW